MGKISMPPIVACGHGSPEHTHAIPQYVRSMRPGGVELWLHTTPAVTDDTHAYNRCYLSLLERSARRGSTGAPFSRSARRFPGATPLHERTVRRAAEDPSPAPRPSRGHDGGTAGEGVEAVCSRVVTGEAECSLMAVTSVQLVPHFG